MGRLDDGSRVYFVLPKAPQGSMAVRTVVPSVQYLPVPDRLGDVTAAAIARSRLRTRDDPEALAAGG
ncbi:hypothetical protein KXS07_03930 [Inquilinus limosus]|uniref:hypothetical protein n=1 Tax=Inquilinus limosus TaxID=171674 RepID=UPI003F158719